MQIYQFASMIMIEPFKSSSAKAIKIIKIIHRWYLSPNKLPYYSNNTSPMVLDKVWSKEYTNTYGVRNIPRYELAF